MGTLKFQKISFSNLNHVQFLGKIALRSDDNGYISGWSKKSKVSPQHQKPSPSNSKLVQFSPTSGNIQNNPSNASFTGNTKTSLSPFRSLPDFSITVSSIGYGAGVPPIQSTGQDLFYSK